MITLELNKPIRVSVDLVEILIQWVPLVTSIFIITFTSILVGKTVGRDPTSRLSRFRNRLAIMFSADVFYKVIQHHEPTHHSQTQTINNTSVQSMVLEDQKQDYETHSCYTQSILITTPLGKHKFYCLYLLSLPMHAVMICLIILEKIFVEEISIESCSSYMLSTRDDSYYSCRLMSEPISLRLISQENIIKYCNSTMMNSTYIDKIDDIICMQFFFDKTKIIEIITNIFVWQKLLATTSVYLIRYFRYLFRRCFRCNENNKAASFSILLLIMMINVGLVVALVILYAIFSNQFTRSAITLDIISIASGALIYVFIMMSIITWKVNDKEGYQTCLFHVSVGT